VQTRDALGNTVSITYDLRGRKTALHDPDLGIRHYAWNAAGDLVRRTDAKGQVTVLQHDGLGRLVRRVEPDLDSRWHYGRHADGSACPHGAGRLCEVVADNGYRRRHVHDAAGRPVRTEFTLDGALYTAAVGYDLASGRVATQTYPSGLQVGRRYTALGWLQDLTDSRSGQPLWRVHRRAQQILQSGVDPASL
jgi:YD repeat-containing protein